VSIISLVLVMFKFIRGENRGTLIAFDQAFEKNVTKDQNIFARMALFFKPIMRRANFAFLFFVLALIGKISWVLTLITVGPLVTLILILITFRSKIFGSKQTA